MRQHIKPQNFQTFDCIIAKWPENTAEHQRSRLLEAMSLRAGVTTLEAMRFLDIIDPRARVVELRKANYSIITSWVRQSSECGRLHNVGLYTLAGNTNSINVGVKTKSPGGAGTNQMVLALSH